MAFATPAGLAARRAPDAPRCRTSAARSRRPRVGRVRCSYAADLQTRAASVDASATDALLDRVTSQITAGEVVPDVALQEMVLHLSDARGMARLGLVNAFGQIGTRATPFLLEGLATCPNAVVRRSCGKALAQIGDSSATQPLITALLADADTVARASAAGALAKIGQKAVPALIDVLAGDAPHAAKGHAAWALAYMQAGAGAPTKLLSAARHEVDDVRLAVVAALGAVLLGDALPVMGETGVDEWGDGEVEGEAGLREEAKKAAEAVLVEALRDSCAGVRAEAVGALASAGRGDYAKEVAELLNDPAKETRRAAALAVMKIGDASVLPALRKCAADAEECDEVGAVARLALRTLERALSEEEEDDW